MTQGNLLPALELEVQQISTLEGASDLVFYYWHVDTPQTILGGNAVLVGTGSTRRIKYNWSGQDTAIVGKYEGYFTFKMNSLPLSAPNGRKLDFEIIPGPVPA